MALTKDQETAFEAFWAAYPPRAGENPKAAAKEVFARRIGSTAPEAIAQAAANYAAACRAQHLDPKFIPHARTWLSQRRYLDHLEAAPASAEPQPSPDPPHPLDWLRASTLESAWRSWIAPLRVEQDPTDQVVVIAPTQFALDQVRQRFGDEIEDHYPAVVWLVSRRETA